MAKLEKQQRSPKQKGAPTDAEAIKLQRQTLLHAIRGLASRPDKGDELERAKEMARSVGIRQHAIDNAERVGRSNRRRIGQLHEKHKILSAQKEIDRTQINALLNDDVDPTEGEKGKAGMAVAADALSPLFADATSRQEIGAMLRREREAAGLTQVQMGELLKIGQNDISRIERGGSASMTKVGDYLAALGKKPLFSIADLEPDEDAPIAVVK